MGYSKSGAIFNIVWGFLLVGFAIYFILCSFVLHVDAESWKHFIWGVVAIAELFLGAADIINGVKTLIKSKEKSKNNK